MNAHTMTIERRRSFVRRALSSAPARDGNHPAVIAGCLDHEAVFYSFGERASARAEVIDLASILSRPDYIEGLMGLSDLALAERLYVSRRRLALRSDPDAARHDARCTADILIISGRAQEHERPEIERRATARNLGRCGRPAACRPHAVRPRATSRRESRRGRVVARVAARSTADPDGDPEPPGDHALLAILAALIEAARAGEIESARDRLAWTLVVDVRIGGEA